MRKISKICLLTLSTIFLPSCSGMNNVPIDGNDENNNNSIFSLSDYDFEQVKSNIGQLFKREEGLTIKATLSDKSIYAVDDETKVEETIIDLNLSGKQDSIWFTYDSKYTEFDEVKDKRFYGLAGKDITTAAEPKIYSCDLEKKTWTEFSSDYYVDIEQEWENVFKFLDIDPYVFSMLERIDMSTITKSSQGGRDCFHLTYDDTYQSSLYRIDLFLDCTILLPMKLTLREDAIDQNLFNTKCSEITYFGTAVDEPNW